ncbi:MAG TPA: hypothetical protein VFH66_10145 [Mycobacteriales bacterium]|nr:hypothetical protein [Mycobacteriales bacterium]
MTGALVGLGILLALGLLVGGAYAVARRRSGGREVGDADANTAEVVSGLMAELRKWQAEAAHWKATAERLQRELDQR